MLKKRLAALALIAVVVVSLTWTALRLYRQSPALPLAGLLHRLTVDPTVDRGGHSRGIVQVDLMRQIMADRARAVPAAAEQRNKVRDRVPSQSHPLLGRPAPPFELKDSRGKTWKTREVPRGNRLSSSSIWARAAWLASRIWSSSISRCLGSAAWARRFWPSVPTRPSPHASGWIVSATSRSRCSATPITRPRWLTASGSHFQAPRRTTASHCTARSSLTATVWSAGPMSAIDPSPMSRRCWRSWTGSNGRGKAAPEASSPRAGDQRRRWGDRNGFTGSPRFAR